MSKTHVHNHTTKIHSLPGKIVLHPGANMVDAKAWEAAKGHEMVEKHIDAKHFSESKLTAGEKKTEAVAEKAADKAAAHDHKK